MFTYHLGIHRGTLTSRDTGQPKEFGTYEAAVLEFQKDKKWYESIGYMIWFATITAPDGKETQLESNSYY